MSPFVHCPQQVSPVGRKGQVSAKHKFIFLSLINKSRDARWIGGGDFNLQGAEASPSAMIFEKERCVTLGCWAHLLLVIPHRHLWNHQLSVLGGKAIPLWNGMIISSPLQGLGSGFRTARGFLLGAGDVIG